MTCVLKLPDRLDISAAKPLSRDIAAMTGDVTLDASEVHLLGGLCLQVLLAARQKALSTGRQLRIVNPSEDFTAALMQFGIRPGQLIDGEDG